MQPDIVKKRLLTSVISAPVALALLTFMLLWYWRAERVYTGWLQHTQHTLNQLEVIKSNVFKAQAFTEAYLLSSDPAHLAASRQAVNQVKTSLTRLRDWTADNAVQRQPLTGITAGVQRWATAIQRAVNPFRAGPRPSLPPSAAIAQITPAEQSLITNLDDSIAAQINFMRTGLRHEKREQTLILWLLPLSAAAVALALIVVSWKEIGAVAREYELVLQDAEEANLKSNNFLANVSHELRNPLNLILLWSRLLLSGERDEDKLKRGLNSIDRAAQVQAQLIEDLLDVAKIESGRLRLDLQPTDLPEVIRAGVDTMSAAVEAKGIDLRVIVDPRAGRITGDPQRLQQALWNLLSNAVKFTPERGRIQVQLARINSHVELAVSDTGQGIAPSFLPHVFDRFWQGEAAEQAQKKGLGLGLTIVRHIVALHGGTIRVHSEGLGRGTTFTVRLPLPMTEGLQYERRPHATVVATPNLVRIPRLTGLQIVVVDDDHEAIEALRAVLTSLGADPVVADGADRALEILSEHHPDAVVSDIAMPGRDGLSLAREIREREQKTHSGHLPLVALTAYGRVEDKVKIFSAGFDSHVVKPVDPAELAVILRSIVEPTRDKA